MSKKLPADNYKDLVLSANETMRQNLHSQDDGKCFIHPSKFYPAQWRWDTDFIARSLYKFDY